MRGRWSFRQCFKWASRAMTLDEVLSAMRKHKVRGGASKRKNPPAAFPKNRG